MRKLWNEGWIVCFVTLKLGGRMKIPKATLTFRKTASCPASATLLSYRCDNLPGEVAGQVKEHLEVCDFCSAELPLLAHHTPATAVSGPPEIPKDLRILAESILGHKKAQKTQK